MLFEFKTVYGRLKFYPVSDEAIAICEIAERKCLDQTQLSKLLVLNSLQTVVMHKDKMLTTKELVALLTEGKLGEQKKGSTV